MLLTAFLTSAALTLSPNLPPERALHIAESIAAVTDSSDDAKLLLVTNFAESTFREDVETCRIAGDHGKAFSAYQLHPWLWGSLWGRQWVCADPHLAARLALFALGSGGSTRTRIARFMGRSPTDKQVLWRERMVRRLDGVGDRVCWR